jgi:hypothetical protein
MEDVGGRRLKVQMENALLINVAALGGTAAPEQPATAARTGRDFGRRRRRTRAPVTHTTAAFDLRAARPACVLVLARKAVFLELQTINFVIDTVRVGIAGQLWKLTTVD